MFTYEKRKSKYSVSAEITQQRENMYFVTCTPSEHSDQPVHRYSLIRAFATHIKNSCNIGYPQSLSKDLIRLADVQNRLSFY